MPYRLPLMVAPPGPLPDRLAYLTDAAEQRAHQPTVPTEGWETTADTYRRTEQYVHQLNGPPYRHLPERLRDQASFMQIRALEAAGPAEEHRAWCSYYAYLTAADLAAEANTEDAA